MPRLTDERREERRRHILTSAWTCFSGNGFHATSMDDVIAATGMSSSAVYRYFRSKDDLIDAAADEALALVRSLFDGLLEQRPTASPAEVVAAMVGEVRDRDSRSEYDLTRIAIQSWGEALRRPGMEERIRAFYLGVQSQLAELALRWREEGHVAADADPRGIAMVLMTLMPGLLVGRHLVAPVSAEHLIEGLSSLGSASWNA
ncbi:TetR/AcrR family transcriptional regulator [Streptomyces sp. RKAG293]|uniref:TetR/AcrR family transcriptional regulator n=1 Tax=Streptomyces sp. RKAG293 TaxID=2893403 RepID=UPI002033D452|nr:TetR/AcrR family transcriptional regulator [Streptomyces sp. RKAG293]MCM2423862.1 TetR/AcrR family transcriptional regulator [Streptomyces sp. RKAG293]